MNNQPSSYSIILLFQSVEKHLHSHKLELALLEVQSILESDPKNLYALAIERRIVHILDFWQKASVVSDAMEYQIARVIAALEHVCQMAVRFLMNISGQTSSQINWTEGVNTTQ
jgi:hypothetical protein